MQSERASRGEGKGATFRSIPGRRANIPLAVRHLIEQYRCFLRTSHRFLDERLRVQFEEHLAEPLGGFEVRSDEGSLVTVPDFAWPAVKVAVFCDGYAFHGDQATLELDARKRNWLQARGWAVLVFWGRTILRDPARCASEVAQVVRGRTMNLSDR